MKIPILCLALLVAVACSQPKSKISGKQYPVTGTVVSIDTKEHTANIDAAAIPNYMDAMKMDYPIASDSDLNALKVGEKISATLVLSDDGSYKLSNIRPATGAGK